MECNNCVVCPITYVVLIKKKIVVECRCYGRESMAWDEFSWPCGVPSIQKLSIISFHVLQKLPDDWGKLSCLRVLILFACLGLKELPTSIWELGKL